MSRFLSVMLRVLGLCGKPPLSSQAWAKVRMPDYSLSYNEEARQLAGLFVAVALTLKTNAAVDQGVAYGAR
jgi:hypothetical protein